MLEETIQIIITDYLVSNNYTAPPSDLIVGQKEDFATVMALSGHKDIRMLKRYTHTRDEAKKVAVNKLGKGLNSPAIVTNLDTEEQNDPQEGDNVIDITD